MFDHALFSAETEKSNKFCLLFSKYAVDTVNIKEYNRMRNHRNESCVLKLDFEGRQINVKEKSKH